MIPDSDGDAQERVYHLMFFHILYSLLPSPPTCRRWAGITLQLNLSTVKPCVLCVLEGSLPNPGAISPMQPTHLFGTEPLTATFYTWNLGSVWILPSFPEASLGALLLKGEVLPLALLRARGAGLHGQSGGD